jgi:urease accessory protein
MHSARSIILAASILLAATPAFAHTGGSLGGFASGLAHPVTGLDHVVAMIAVGLWGGILGAPALWLLPIVFPLVMALGGAAGVAGLPLPGIEAGIALSGVVLGLMVLMAARPPLWLAAVLVGLFAVFHGHAHGAELPASADPAIYAVGFVVATGLLHLAGIALGRLDKWSVGRVAVRCAGAAIAVAGGAFLTGFA